MYRRYQRELYAERVAKIKELMPHACIGVDVIVGFPGESHEDFLETYHFLNELEISYLHVFPYSERANTKAIELEGVVPLKTRQERTRQLISLSEKKKRQFYQEHLGQQATVLFEDDVKEGQMEGFTENYIRVVAKYDPLLINELKKVQLSSINAEGLVEVEEVQEYITH